MMGMNDTKNKTSSESLEVFTHTQVGMLIEHFENQFKAVIEGQEALSEQVQIIALSQAKMIKKMDRLEDRMTAIEKRMDSIEKRMDSIEKRMDSIEKRMDSIEKRMDSLEKEVRDIKAALKRTAGKEEIQRLEKRMDTLEKKVAYLEAR